MCRRTTMLRYWELKSNRILLSLLAGSSVALIAASFDIVIEAMRVPSLIGHGLDFCLLLTFWTASFWVILGQIRGVGTRRSQVTFHGAAIGRRRPVS